MFYLLPEIITGGLNTHCIL